MITIVNYGLGNLGSIRNMLLRIGVESVITDDLETIRGAERLILPGVGAFDNAMANLNRLGIAQVLNERVLERRVPILGICLGMQLMSRRSEEGSLPGLGWVDAETVRFRFEGEAARLKIPHMGWNRIERARQDGILGNQDEESRFYFVHSYHVRCNEEQNVLATTDYGFRFHSALIRDNVVGMQFHPEKSHRFGMQLMKNFIGWCP